MRTLFYLVFLFGVLLSQTAWKSCDEKYSQSNLKYKNIYLYNKAKLSNAELDQIVIQIKQVTKSPIVKIFTSDDSFGVEVVVCTEVDSNSQNDEGYYELEKRGVELRLVVLKRSGVRLRRNFDFPSADIRQVIDKVTEVMKNSHFGWPEWRPGKENILIDVKSADLVSVTLIRGDGYFESAYFELSKRNKFWKIVNEVFSIYN